MHIHDTYFVVAHFHFIMVGGAIMGYFAGLHYWWPKITGRMYSDIWAKVAAIIVFVGFNLTFVPQFILGYLGMPRRYHVYPRGVPGAERAVVGRRLDPRRRLPAGRASTSWPRSSRARRPATIRGTPPASSGRRSRRRCRTTSTTQPVVTEGAYEYSKREIKVV